jgi:beta-glucosidase
VQVYLSAPNSSLDRPVRWLAGYAPVRAAAGETVPVAITVPARAFATWNDDAWRYETGRYQVQVGTSVTDLPLEDTVRLTD